MDSPVVAIATSADVLGHDEDQPLLDQALAAEGLDVRLWAWDDPAAAWSSADIVVIRSTWDYADRRDRFCEWADETAAIVPVHNGADAVRWNTDKRYLADLAAARVAVTPTTWLDPGDAVVLPDAREVVIKPTVSAGSKDTTRHNTERAAQDAVAAAESLLDAGRAVMVQPYLEAVDEAGETGLVYIDGMFHHAFRKGALLIEGRQATDRLYAPEQIEPTRATDEERVLAEATLAAMPFAASDLLYARVDVAPGPDGSPVLMELELVEPSLFFKACDQPATALARAIVSRL